MVERKRNVPGSAGNLKEGTVVDVEESTERFSEVRLGDGTILKTKLTVVEVVRIDDEWDSDGNPAYVVKSGNVVVVSESPPELWKKGSVK